MTEAFQKHLATLQATRLTDLFLADPKRQQNWTCYLNGISVDLSRHFITQETLSFLSQQCAACDLKDRIDQLFAGEVVNPTESRAALHTALRAPDLRLDHRIPTARQNDILRERKAMSDFVRSVHAGRILSYQGQPFDTIVNIGIGGSDLGPRMACEALRQFSTPNLQCFFVSNVDYQDLSTVLTQINPATTLFIIASKTFTTQETLFNANAAKQWFLSQCPESAIAKHFVALTAAPDQAGAFGIPPVRCFSFGDDIGGRFSLFSSIGLSLALMIGMEQFNACLAGAYMVDLHFHQTDLHENVPVLMAWLQWLYTQYFHANTYAILPYDQRLLYFPAYCQQLMMESLGKSVHLDGTPVEGYTGPIVWGGVGTNGQHAFHQLLHQGTHFVPVDFIIANQPGHQNITAHQLLEANLQGQAQALLRGQTTAAVVDQLVAQGMDEAAARALAPHQSVPGNRPSTVIRLTALNPETLGALIALYEHQVFVLGVLYDVNPFDQWGVELGKAISRSLLAK